MTASLQEKFTFDLVALIDVPYYSFHHLWVKEDLKGLDFWPSLEQLKEKNKTIICNKKILIWFLFISNNLVVCITVGEITSKKYTPLG